MNEVIPCEGHSQNTKQSPSIGIAVATPPLLPMVKENCPKSWMTIFTQRKRGIGNKILHNDRQRETNPSVSFAILWRIAQVAILYIWRMS